MKHRRIGRGPGRALSTRCEVDAEIESHIEGTVDPADPPRSLV